ncbi:hypothetical protein F4678DRAFT_444456 [Xylaria arbuscula]|nr:hypothetical protein F4678DRAFT_444456 [Xylaria arbuscula]
MATTFHPFLRLPVELRIQIWALAVGPRRLDIGPHQMEMSLENMSHFKWGGTKYTSRIPPPGVMHACRESRQHARYQKAFFSPPDRYLWVNFQQDMICLAHYEVKVLAPHYADIERLRYTVPDARDEIYVSEWFRDCSHEILGVFSALKELHVTVHAGLWSWGTSLDNAGFAECLQRNTKFINLQTGLMLNIPQMDMVYRWHWEDGGKVKNVHDLDYEYELFWGSELSEFAEID